MAAPTWVFDVDGTLIDALTGGSLRPGAEALLARLHAQGCRLLLWSAGGGEYAGRRAAAHGLDGYFDGYFDKDERDADGRYVPAFLRSAFDATFVDDQPADLPIGAEVVAVSPYLAPDPHDRGLERALADR